MFESFGKKIEPEFKNSHPQVQHIAQYLYNQDEDPKTTRDYKIDRALKRARLYCKKHYGIEE